RAFRTEISLADRAMRVPLDLNDFAVLVINELSATDAAIRTNRPGDFGSIDARMQRACGFGHSFHSGSACAVTDLTQKWPTPKAGGFNLLAMHDTADAICFVSRPDRARSP